MNRFMLGVVGLAVVTAGGCKEGTSTAPATNPDKPSQARKLTIRTLYEHKVHRDGTDELTVAVDRDNFAGPVAVELRDLPKGVSVVTQEMTIPAGKDSLTVTVKAAPDAPLVNDHVVKVAARAKEQADMPEAVADFKLDVLTK